MLKITNDELSFGIDLVVGQEIPLQNLIKTLSALGYARVDRIDANRQFSVRGDVLDLCFDIPKGYRILYFGDEIEAIKMVNTDNFTTTKQVPHLHIPPHNDGVNFFIKRCKICVLSTEIDTEICVNLMPKSAFFAPKNTKIPPNLRQKSHVFDRNLTTHFRHDTPIGALVWHEKYGIGKYVGAKKMNLGGGTQSYIALQFFKKAVVYVPLSQIDQLYNYHGSSRRLDKL